MEMGNLTIHQMYSLCYHETDSKQTVRNSQELKMQKTLLPGQTGGGRDPA